MVKSTTHIHGEPFERYCNGCFDLLAVAAAKAEKERDAATGALAAAMEVLRVLERTRPPDFATFAVARCPFCWCSAPESGGDDHDADCPVQRVIRSPAADLAARHDAEVERRALEKAVQLVLSKENRQRYVMMGPMCLAAVAKDIAALTTPALEKL